MEGVGWGRWAWRGREGKAGHALSWGNLGGGGNRSASLPRWPPPASGHLATSCHLWLPFPPPTVGLTGSVEGTVGCLSQEPEQLLGPPVASRPPWKGPSLGSPQSTGLDQALLSSPVLRDQPLTGLPAFSLAQIQFLHTAARGVSLEHRPQCVTASPRASPQAGPSTWSGPPLSAQVLLCPLTLEVGLILPPLGPQQPSPQDLQGSTLLMGPSSGQLGKGAGVLGLVREVLRRRPARSPQGRCWSSPGAWQEMCTHFPTWPQACPQLFQEPWPMTRGRSLAGSSGQTAALAQGSGLHQVPGTHLPVLLPPAQVREQLCKARPCPAP